MPFTAPASDRITAAGSDGFLAPDSAEGIESRFMAGQQELTDADAAAIARRRAQRKRDPSAYLEGASGALGGMFDTAKKTLAEQASTALPTPQNTLERTKALAEGALQGSQMLGTIGRDAAEAYVLNPYKVLSQAIQKRGLKDTAVRLAAAVPTLATPSIDSPTTRLLDIFPQEASSVIREDLNVGRERSRDAQKLSEGSRTLGGELTTALAADPIGMLPGGGFVPESIRNRVGLSPETAQKVGQSVASNLPASAEAFSMVADPTIPATMGASGLLKLGPEAFMTAGARKMATAMQAREALRAAAAAEGRRLSLDEALRMVPDAPPVQVPPVLPANLDQMGANFATASREAVDAAKPGALQRAVGAVGRGTEAAGRGVEAAADSVGSFIDRNETPLSMVSGAAGLVKGPVAAYVSSKIPAGVKATAKWAKGASKWGSALRTVAAADWSSKMPIWRQVANNADAPQWLVKGITAPVYRDLVAGEAVEKGLRTAGDIVGPAAKGAAVGSALAATDPDKTAEELGGVSAISGALGLATATAGAKNAAKTREAEASALTAMKRADRAIREGQNPIAVALTADSTMVAADMLEKIGQSKMAGGKDRSDLKVDLLDAENFKKVAPEGNAAAFFDTANNRIAVNVESRDAEGRIFHEGGHAIMQSVIAANPAILEHFQRVLGPEGLMKAREEYAKALGVDVNTLPTDPAFIASELFSEATSHALRGRDISKKVEGDTKESAYTFFSDPRVRAAIEDPLTQEIVRQQFAALQDYRPSVDMGKETGIKLTSKQAGEHPALPKESDFVTTTADGRVVEAPPQVIRRRVKSRQAEVDGFFPQTDPVSDPGEQVQSRRTMGGDVQRTGRRLGERFYNAAQTFAESTKNMLRQVEQSIVDGTPLAGWYQEIGRTAEGWSGSVRERLGNVSAQFKDFIPFQFKVSKEGNLLIENYSLTAFERKANEWAKRDGPLSLAAWNGDIGQFRQDVQTYLRNHAEGRPGSDGIGEAKRNLINVFMVGGNRQFEASNPLRPLARGQDRQGIVRSYRADRLQTVEPSEVTGFSQPDYGKQVQNLSPEVRNSPNVNPQVETPEFKRWFGDSRVVREDGSPMVVYHGTSKDTPFTSFRKNSMGSWFTSDPESASAYAATNDSQRIVHENGKYVTKNTSGHVMPAYLSIKNPMIVEGDKLQAWRMSSNYRQANRMLVAEAKSAGHDGLQFPDGIYVAFEPTQIKSATGNRGTFDPAKSDIRKSPRIEQSVNDLDKLGNKDLPQVNAKTIKYPSNPDYPNSIALPSRWGLVNEKIAGMPKTSKEVVDIVSRQVDRLERVIQDMPEFAKESARFYLDMGLSSLDLSSIALPHTEGLEQHNMADLMLRFLALGSPRTGVAANATKSSYSISAAASDFTPGMKIGFGAQQRGAKAAMASWKQGLPFDLNMPGIDNKVRNFYLNGISEIIDLAKKNGDTAAYEHLMTNVAGSLGLIEAGAPLPKEMYAEVQRLLDGMATVDMWDMAAKGFAWPGYLIDPAKRNDPAQPWQWSQEKFAETSTFGDPLWQQVLKELSDAEGHPINGPEDLRYQQARALRIEGNKDWSEKTWKARLDSGKPFDADTPFTVFNEGSEAGLSPGGAGPLYDAQQSIDGLIADEINRRGLAPLFGKDKLLARNAQEILWALERLDNPVEANNELVLFGQTFKPMKEVIEALRAGEKTDPKNRGNVVLDAMERAYSQMANQDIPIEVVSAGTSPEAARIQNKIAELKAAGVPDAERIVTETVAQGLMEDLNASAEKHGLNVTLDNVRVGLGGYSEGGAANTAPNMVLRLRGAIPDVKRVLEVLSRSMDQDGGNIFRRPTIREINDPKTKLNNVLTFDTRGLNEAQQKAFFEDLNKLKDAEGNSFLTGFTQTGDGMAIGDQFYGGDMVEAANSNWPQIMLTLRKHGVSGVKRERLVISTFSRGTPAEKAYAKNPFVRDLTQRVQSRIDGAAPAERQFPVVGDAKSRIERLTKQSVRQQFDSKTEATRHFVDLASQVDIAILRDEITEKDGEALKADINRIQKRKIAQTAQKSAALAEAKRKEKEDKAQGKASNDSMRQ